jgi:hypothetical protein
MNKINLFSLLVIVFCFGCEPPEKVDLILHNGIIYTVNPTFDIEEALVIKDGKIIAVGPEHEIMNKYSSDNVIDLAKKPVYPGFYDAHCHFKSFAEKLNTLDLVGTNSLKEVIDWVKSYAEEHKSSKWIIGRGWDQNDWTTKNFPTKDQLDSLFPDKPVFLKRVDGHAALVNQKALDLANISNQTKINGGKILTYKDLEINDIDTPCGILIDNAVDLINAILPVLTEAELLKMYQKAEKELFKVGLTTINDAGVKDKDISILKKFYENGELTINNYLMIEGTIENVEKYASQPIYNKNGLHIRSFKFMADGALGSRGACLLSPYNDDENNYGFLLNHTDFYDTCASILSATDYQMNTHCIGDSANRLLLDIYGKYLKGTNDKRWKIEHAQVVNPSDVVKFKSFNVIPSIQPTHCTSDMYWADERLGDKRIQHAYAYQTLLQQNGLVALGTDFPVENINPVYTFYAVTVRKDLNGYPENGFQPNEKLTKEQALKGMTIWAAISNFEENNKGSLEIGKNANLVVLDKDIMKVKDDEIISASVILNIIDGKIVYQVDEK